MSFLNFFWGFWNWLSNLIEFTGANYPVSSSEGSADNL